MRGSDPIGKNHVADLSNHLRRGRMAELAVVDEPLGEVRWPGPAADLFGRIPMRDVDVKARVVGNLEEYDLAVVGQRALRLEAPDCDLRGLDPFGPGVGEQLARRGEVAVARITIHGVTPFSVLACVRAG